ncbi:MAG: hypothetical protein PGN13_13620 [Patulibacter minatonensis]
MSLELQAAYKFALAIVVGLGGVFAVADSVLAALTLIVAVLVAGRALVVLGAEPTDRKTFRPTDEATLDAVFASAWAVLAVVLAADGAVIGALVAGAGAVALAFLRLRTRYVI